ncbi:hypothetical protein BJ165DRAFT_689365 [Panaeolus papilionaceus]|nr:hypothetical protein BJ165DRAFT_689365 [Panaeolus papilionaceus]
MQGQVTGKLSSRVASWQKNDSNQLIYCICTNTVSKKDIERLQIDEKLRILNRRRNALAPVSVLPPELLSNIFVVIRDATYHSFQDPADTFSWTKVAHVCHDWRRVAMSNAQLWSTADFQDVDTALQFVKRSKQSPLRMRVVVPFKLRTATVLGQVIQSEAYRLQCIEASSDSWQSWWDHAPAFLMAFDNIRMPNLHTLTIALGRPEDNPDTQAYELPPGFLAGGASQLQYLCLKGVSLPWTSPLLSGLSSLELESWTSSSSTPTEFLSALQNLPSLSHLTLDNIPESLIGYTGQFMLSWPHLNQLRVRSAIENVCAMLRHLELSISTKLIIIIDLQETILENLDRSSIVGLMELVASAWLSDPLCFQTPTSDSLALVPTRRCMRSIYMTDHDTTEEHFMWNDFQTLLTVRAWPDEHDFARLPARISDEELDAQFWSPFSLTLLPPLLATYRGFHLMEVLLGALPLEDLRSFDTHIMFRGHVPQILGLLPRLTSVSVGDPFNDPGINHSCFSALRHSNGFRRLQSLAFDKADFGGLHGTYYNAQICWDEFLDFCTYYRTVDNEPLKHIRLVGCKNLDQDKIDQLSGMVAEVDWDGCVS